jgi:hypothetical protein
MKKPSEEFLLSYDEDMVDEARGLLSHSTEHTITPSTPGLYLCHIKDGTTFKEIELLSPYTLKQKATCDCAQYQNNLKPCKHIVASLIMLYQQSKAKPNPKTSAKLNVQAILDTVSHQDLIIFVAAQAREDRKLATALKVHFARKIEVNDNIEKYRTLLNDVIKPITGTTSRVSASDIRTFVDIAEDFKGQIEDCIALGQYIEAIDLLTVTFNKLAYVQYHWDYSKEKVVDLYRAYHHLWYDCAREPLPITQKKRLMEHASDMASKLYYTYVDADRNLSIFIHTHGQKEDKAYVQELLKSHLQSKKLTERNYVFISYLKCSKSVGTHEVDLCRQQGINFMDIVDLLMATDNDPLARSWITAIEKAQPLERTLTLKKLQLLYRSGDIGAFDQQCIVHLVSTEDMSYLDLLTRCTQADRLLDVYYQVRTKLDQKTKPSHAFVIKVYRQIKYIEGMMDILEEEFSLDTLRAFEMVIYQTDPILLVTYYTRYLHDYLRTHLGEHSHEEMRSLRVHLNRHQLHAIVSPIEHLLKKEYHDRPGLLQAFLLRSSF